MVREVMGMVQQLALAVRSVEDHCQSAAENSEAAAKLAAENAAKLAAGNSKAAAKQVASPASPSPSEQRQAQAEEVKAFSLDAVRSARQLLLASAASRKF